MKLSFCIPTYNRCQFLKKNINIIIGQIHDLSVEQEVEILVSDNASTDDTETMCKDIICKNKDISIEYHKNEKNEGPDWNFIKSMKLAHGEYSILLGDDDFLIDNGLSEILQLLDTTGISIYYSNRICIDNNGRYLNEQIMLDSSKERHIFDFTNEDSVRSFFCGIKGLRSIMSFISSVVYRTEIVEKFNFDERIIGTNYAFLFYWWKELLSGGKLLYLNKSLVESTTSGSTNCNYGDLVNRALVDYIGIMKICDLITDDKSIKMYFYKAINLAHPHVSLQELYIKDHKNFELKLKPVLLKTGRDMSEINLIESTSSLKWFCKVIYYKFFKNLI